jgi:hypothetical protein
MAIDRGNTVFFKNITFTDEEGGLVVADTATLALSYPSGGSFVDATVTLTLQDDSTWQGSWDSTVSDNGTVHGTLEGVGTNADEDPITCTKDFKFKLTWNRSNEAVNG